MFNQDHWLGRFFKEIVGGLLVVGVFAALFITAREVITSWTTITEDRFIELAEEEGLRARKPTLRRMYRDVQKDTPALLHDEWSLRQLVADLRDKQMVYDGSRFYRVENHGTLTPEHPAASWVTRGVKLEVSDTSVPLKFFLDNWAQYGRRIFLKLTHQDQVDFLFDVDRQGRYGFRVAKSVRQQELFSFISAFAPERPEQLERAGTRWWIPGKELPNLPRLHRIEHAYVDHLGEHRTVSVDIDLAHTFVNEPTPIMVTPTSYTLDFADYVILDDSIRALAQQITAPYRHRDDQARAILAFGQSYRYQRDRLEGTKTAHAFLVSEEGDCEDASTLVITLWEAAGFDAAFLQFDSRTEGQPGHVMAAIAQDSCCGDGAGFSVNNRSWLLAEATDMGWKIGQQSSFPDTMILKLIRPYKGEPIHVQLVSSP